MSPVRTTEDSNKQTNEPAAFARGGQRATVEPAKAKEWKDSN
jgi:hypothetical protein